MGNRYVRKGAASKVAPPSETHSIKIQNLVATDVSDQEVVLPPAHLGVYLGRHK